MKLKENQRGFGTVEIIVALVVVAAIGGIAFSVFARQDASQDTTETTEQEAKTVETDKDSTKESQSKSSGKPIASEFPKEAIPDIDYEVIESATITNDGKETTFLEIKIKGSMADVEDATKAALSAGGWTIVNTLSPGGAYTSLNVTKNELVAGGILWEPTANEPGYITWSATIGLSGI